MAARVLILTIIHDYPNNTKNLILYTIRHILLSA